MYQMPNMNHLSHSELVAAIQKNSNEEKKALVLFLAYGAEALRRKIYREQAKSSLYSWFTETFRLSETVSCRRIAVIRAMVRVPESQTVILESIAEGHLNVDGMALLARHFTAANHVRLIQEAQGKSRRDIEFMLALRFPGSAKLSKSDHIRPVVVPISYGSHVDTRDKKEESPIQLDLLLNSFAGGEASQLDDAPISIGMEIRTTLEGSEIDDLRRLQELMPGKSLKNIIAAALRHYRNKKDLGQSMRKSKDRENPPSSSSKVVPSCGNGGSDRARPYIPASIRRKIYRRDNGRCCYISDLGERCSERGFLEFDHIIPHARGGETSERNLRLLCRSHNDLSAEYEFGESYISRKKKNFKLGRSEGRRIPKVWLE